MLSAHGCHICTTTTVGTLRQVCPEHIALSGLIQHSSSRIQISLGTSKGTALTGRYRGLQGLGALPTTANGNVTASLLMSGIFTLLSDVHQLKHYEEFLNWVTNRNKKNSVHGKIEN